jgi:hypothetical protein
LHSTLPMLLQIFYCALGATKQRIVSWTMVTPCRLT